MKSVVFTNSENSALDTSIKAALPEALTTMPVLTSYEVTNSAAIAAETLFQAALQHVDSASIKGWAQTEHNRPIFLKLATLAIEKNGPSANPHMFAAYIVSNAIGL